MYWPPARGNKAANSPYESAAETVSNPVRIQVRRRPPAEPVFRVRSAATMKMPEPIMEATTIMVPSKSPMARTKPVSCFAAIGSGIVCVVSGILGFLNRRRAIGLAEYVEKLPGAVARTAREQNIANYRHAVGARFDDRFRSVESDATDGHDGFLG